MSDLLLTYRELQESTRVDAYLYLPAGQLASGGANTFSWRPFGLPASISNSNGHSSTYKYDASGGALHAYSIVADDVVGQLRHVTNSAGTRLSRQVQYFHSDNLGSPDVISSHGAPIERVKYEPYGERRHHWALAHPMPAPHQANASYGFTGHQPDDAFGLVNMRGRIYSPRTTRFHSPDPFFGSDSEALNRFSYVRNSPVMLKDPSGYLSVPAFVSNALGGPAGFEADISNGGFDAEVPSTHVYEAVVRGKRTTDASDNTIYAPGLELPASLERPSTSGNARGFVATKNLLGAQKLQGGARGTGCYANHNCREVELWAQRMNNLAHYKLQRDNLVGVDEALFEFSQWVGGHQLGMAYLGEDYLTETLSWRERLSLFFSGGERMVMVATGIVSVGSLTRSTAVFEGETSRVLLRAPKQLQAKFKHASDFGVTGNYNKSKAVEFSSAIHQHINNPDVRVIEGTYHQPVTHYLDPSTGLNVMADPAGNFISGWKLSPGQLQNVLTHGGL